MVLRPHDILALRAGASAQDVLNFKARVDELSRLAAGRAEDEALIAQIEARLQKLDPSATARVVAEVRYRDEWREERCEQALRALPAAASGVDGDAFDRMRAYVALLAPPKRPPEADAAMAPWQRELARQQHALASLLQLCPTGSADAVHATLHDFMAHSAARLQQRVAAVQARLSAAPSRESESAAAPPPRRDAWSEEPAPPPPPTVNGGAAQFDGLSADDFVAKLRVQHTAVCAVQAHARGALARRRFAAAAAARCAAAIAVQCRARVGKARRAAAAAAAAQARGARGDARRVARGAAAAAGVAVARAVGRWRAAWRKRAAAQCRADDLEWRAAVRASLVPRAPEASGFSSQSIYIESKSLAERRAAEDAAAAALQAARRGTLARRARAAAVAAAVVLQAGARRRRAVARALWWRRALGRLRAARRARARWRAGREAARALLPAQRRAVLASLHVGKEVAAVQADAARERRDFEESFRKWAAKMTKTMLARKLPSDWIPQMNTLTGASYFFNLKTGEAAEEHPNLKAAKKTERTQRKLAEEQLSERLATLREYEERLADGRAQVLERYAAEAAAAWATLG